MKVTGIILSCAVRCHTGHGFAVVSLDFRRGVVAPAHDNADALRFLRNEEAQAHRRREEAFLGGLAFLVRSSPRPAISGVTSISSSSSGVTAFFGYMPDGIKSRRDTNLTVAPGRQPFVAEGMACRWANEVEF